MARTGQTDGTAHSGTPWSDSDPNTPQPLLNPTAGSTNTDDTDDHLITRFHREALPWFDVLFRRAVQLTRNHRDAEDLFRETLVVAYAGFHALPPGTKFTTWVCQIMTNTYMNGYRKGMRQAAQCPSGHSTDALVTSAVGHWSTGLPSAKNQAPESISGWSTCSPITQPPIRPPDRMT
jgi:RNA polymerase sigma-70 factor (ECF subfamily)